MANNSCMIFRMKVEEQQSFPWGFGKGVGIMLLVKHGTILRATWFKWHITDRTELTKGLRNHNPSVCQWSTPAWPYNNDNGVVMIPPMAYN